MFNTNKLITINLGCKPRTILLCVFALVVFQLHAFGGSRYGKAVISGQVVGNVPQWMQFTVPVNGAAYEGFFETVEIDSLGRFTILVETEKPVFLKFMFIDSHSFIVEPNKAYDIILNVSLSHTVRFGGNISEIQQFYNSLIHSHPRSCIFTIGTQNVTEYVEKGKELEAMLQQELEIFEEFYQNGKIPKDVFSLLVADRTVYFNTAKAVMASMNFSNVVSAGGIASDALMGVWADAVSWAIADNPFLLHAIYAYEYLLMTLWYHLYATHSFDDIAAIRAERRLQQTIHSHTIEVASELFSGKVLEFFTAAYLYQQYLMNSFDQDWIAVFEQFKAQYPKSNYTRFLTPLMARANAIVEK
ncbi:MAG TPA: hypothetical protein DCM62_04805 [Bacteroidales bacterium]|nr:hypothetical protein [Bacteroidales bacterium]